MGKYYVDPGVCLAVASDVELLLFYELYLYILQKVQVDFVARTAEDFDSHGIRNLLQQVD